MMQLRAAHRGRREGERTPLLLTAHRCCSRFLRNIQFVEDVYVSTVRV